MSLKSQLFSKKLVANWFLEEKRPYEARRRFNLKVVTYVAGGLTLIFMAFILFVPVPETSTGQSIESQTLQTPQKNNEEKDPERMNSPEGSGTNYASAYSGISTSRNRNANQIIRRSSQNSDSLGMIAMGTAIGAKLINAVVSANAASPVIALIEEPNGQIPSGTKAIGTATFDEQVRRMSIHFHTIVYPDGEQHAVQAIAMMPDGSAGLEGDYSSGEGKRQIGKLLGYFVSGMAEGMKDRSASGGLMGGSYEPGSIKNGVLNGVSRSAEDQAHELSDSMSNQHPTMSLPSGLDFVFYFEREFNP